MPRWEACVIDEMTLEAPQAGLFVRRGARAWQVVRSTPSGSKADTRSRGWAVNTDGFPADDEQRVAYSEQRRALVAQRGREGWEPMPIGDRLGTIWYFKRQVLDTELSVGGSG